MNTFFLKKTVFIFPILVFLLFTNLLFFKNLQMLDFSGTTEVLNSKNETLFIQRGDRILFFVDSIFKKIVAVQFSLQKICEDEINYRLNFLSKTDFNF